MKAWVTEEPPYPTAKRPMKCVITAVPASLQANEMLIRVVCAGVTQYDARRLCSPDASASIILGSEGSGVVVRIGTGLAAGSGASVEFSVGDRVCFHQDPKSAYGSFGEYCVVKASSVIKVGVPSAATALSFAEAAALPVASWTAYIALFDKLQIKTGRTILINGAAGGVGSYACQLAKAAGCTVIGTCSTYNVSYLVDTLGVALAIDYTTENIEKKVLNATNRCGVDYVLQLAPVTNVVEIVSLLRYGGALCCVAGAHPATIDIKYFTDNQLSLHFVNLAGLYGSLIESYLGYVGQQTVQLASSGQVKVPLQQLIKFEQIPDALVFLASGHCKGKIVANLLKQPQQQKPPGGK